MKDKIKKKKGTVCGRWGSHNSVAEDSGLLGCDSVSLGEQFLVFVELSPVTLAPWNVRQPAHCSTMSTSKKEEKNNGSIH